MGGKNSFWDIFWKFRGYFLHMRERKKSAVVENWQRVSLPPTLNDRTSKTKIFTWRRFFQLFGWIQLRRSISCEESNYYYALSDSSSRQVQVCDCYHDTGMQTDTVCSGGVLTVAWTWPPKGLLLINCKLYKHSNYSRGEYIINLLLTIQV